MSRYSLQHHRSLRTETAPLTPIRESLVSIRDRLDELRATTNVLSPPRKRPIQRHGKKKKGKKRVVSPDELSVVEKELALARSQVQSLSRHIKDMQQSKREKSSRARRFDEYLDDDDFDRLAHDEEQDETEFVDPGYGRGLEKTVPQQEVVSGGDGEDVLRREDLSHIPEIYSEEEFHDEAENTHNRTSVDKVESDQILDEEEQKLERLREKFKRVRDSMSRGGGGGRFGGGSGTDDEFIAPRNELDSDGELREGSVEEWSAAQHALDHPRSVAPQIMVTEEEATSHIRSSFVPGEDDIYDVHSVERVPRDHSDTSARQSQHPFREKMDDDVHSDADSVDAEMTAMVDEIAASLETPPRDDRSEDERSIDSDLPAENVHGLIQKMDVLASKVSQHEEAFQLLKKEKDRQEFMAEKEIEILKEERRVILRGRDQLADEVTDLQKKLRNMRTEDEELRKEVEQTRKKAETELEEVRAAYADQMKEIQEKNHILSAEIESLMTRFSAQQSTIAELEGKNESYQKMEREFAIMQTEWERKERSLTEKYHHLVEEVSDVETKLKREFQEKERRLKSQVEEGRSLLKDSQVAIEAAKREVDRKERESTLRVRTLEDDGRRTLQELAQKLDSETREKEKLQDENARMKVDLQELETMLKEARSSETKIRKELNAKATALLRSENTVDELTENIAERDRKLETISSELERVKSRYESIIEDLRDKNKDLNTMLTEYRERLSDSHANHEKFVKRVEDEYLAKMRGAEEKKEQIERERMALLRKESSLVQEMDELRAELREKDAIVEIKENEWVHQLQELKDQVSHERLEWQGEVQMLEKQLEDKLKQMETMNARAAEFESEIQLREKSAEKERQLYISKVEQERQLRMELQETRTRLENELTQLKKKMENDVRSRLELASDREQALLEVQRLRKAVERERKKREDAEVQYERIQSKMEKMVREEIPSFHEGAESLLQSVKQELQLERERAIEAEKLVREYDEKLQEVSSEYARKEIRFRAHDDELQATKGKMLELEDRVFQLQRGSESDAVTSEREAKRSTVKSSSSGPSISKHSKSTMSSSPSSHEGRSSVRSGGPPMTKSKKREEEKVKDDDDYDDDDGDDGDDGRREKLSKSSVLVSSSMLSTRPSMTRLTSPSRGQSLFGGRSLKEIYSAKASERVRNIVESLSPARRKHDTMTMTMRSPDQSRMSSSVPRRKTIGGAEMMELRRSMLDFVSSEDVDTFQPTLGVVEEVHDDGESFELSREEPGGHDDVSSIYKEEQRADETAIPSTQDSKDVPISSSSTMVSCDGDKQSGASLVSLPGVTSGSRAERSMYRATVAHIEVDGEYVRSPPTKLDSGEARQIRSERDSVNVTGKRLHFSDEKQ